MINLASSSFDGTVKLWSLESDEPIAEIEGKKQIRIGRGMKGDLFRSCTISCGESEISSIGKIFSNGMVIEIKGIE